MLKGKPLIITAIVFGAIGLVLLIFGGVLFIDSGTDILDFIGSVLGLEKGRGGVATVCQFAVVFEVMALIIGFRAITDEAF